MNSRREPALLIFKTTPLRKIVVLLGGYGRSNRRDLTKTSKHFNSLDDVKSDTARFDNAWTAARDITIKTFAEHDSPSVQATMYTMAEKILAAVPEVESVDYALPNKHYFEIGELSYD